MGIQRVKMKGFLFWLIRWACRAGARDFCCTLAALVGPVQNFFLHRTLLQFLRPHRLASWPGWAEKAQKLAFQAEKSAFWADKKFTFSGRKGDFSDEKVFFQHTHCLLEFPSGSQSHSPLLGDKSDYGTGLSYRPTSLCSLLGPSDNPKPKATFFPRSGTMNWTSRSEADF